MRQDFGPLISKRDKQPSLEGLQIRAALSSALAVFLCVAGRIAGVVDTLACLGLAAVQIRAQRGGPALGAQIGLGFLIAGSGCFRGLCHDRRMP